MAQIQTDLTKGNPISITVTFQDSLGEPAQPSSATITFAYYVNRVLTSETMDMIDTVEGWTVTWDSSPADVGVIDYSITAEGPRMVKMGSFRLEGNKANP
jgi:hypothetical protein